MNRSDEPLQSNAGPEDDELGRWGFAQKVSRSLLAAKASGSYVVSLEGVWGSGKTSTVSLIRRALADSGENPEVVDFNPWLVGDREALLHSLFVEMAVRLEMKSASGRSADVARALRKYSGVLSLGRYIPGGEVPAAVADAVARVMTKTADERAANNAPSLQKSKSEIHDALGSFDRKVIIIIDDLDRLYPAEIMEMLRVVKAAGDLPNIRYLLAFDPHYIVDSLLKLGIPRAGDYVDKIVQQRMPIPPLSSPVKFRLINKFYNACDPAVGEQYFQGAKDALGVVYLHGIRPLLNQPRDFIRVFNTFDALEEGLRGEIRVGDILGLAALYVKAQPVYELLINEPQAFVGNVDETSLTALMSEQTVEGYAEQRQSAYAESSSPIGAKRLAHCLFPLVSEADDEDSFARYLTGADGAISAPGRLAVALQQLATQDDVSLVDVRRYISRPQSRDEVVGRLTDENRKDFLIQVGDSLECAAPRRREDRVRLALHLAALLDADAFVQEDRRMRSEALRIRASTSIGRAVKSLMQSASPDEQGEFLAKLSESQGVTSFRAMLLVKSCFKDVDTSHDLALPAVLAGGLLQSHIADVKRLAREGRLFRVMDPFHCLRVIGRLRPSEAPAIFQAIEATPGGGDEFVSVLTASGQDLERGLVFDFSKPDFVWRDFGAFVDLESLTQMGERRLQSDDLEPRFRAAWEALTEQGRCYEGSYTAGRDA